jgi:effector-binding domain-containing protein
MIGEPRIYTRAELPTMGIRIQTPFSGMFKHINLQFKELNAWIKKRGIVPAGPPMLRYHVIDMNGEMDIEASIPVAEPMEADGRVKPDILPGGRYASLVYTNSGMAGNKALIQWGMSQGLAWDRWDDPKGDAFRSRYEAYLTDPKIEPRKTRWDIEVAIKLADDQSVKS